MKRINELQENDIIILDDGRQATVDMVIKLPTGDYELWWRIPKPHYARISTYLATKQFEVVSNE